MRARSYSVLLLCLLALGIASCSSSRRTSVEGYSDAQLNNKRIALLVPQEEDLTIENPSAFASARGGVDASARNMLSGELRTSLSAALGQQFDSNTVLIYQDQAVGGIVPLDATDDFNGGTPTAWDQVKKAAREGNLDYMIVLNNVTVSNSTPTGSGLGTEEVEADYALIDMLGGKVMTKGKLSFKVDDPRTASMTSDRLAEEISKRLPFFVAEE